MKVERHMVLIDGRSVEVVSAGAFDELAVKFGQLMGLFGATVDLAALAVAADGKQERP